MQTFNPIFIASSIFEESLVLKELLWKFTALSGQELPENLQLCLKLNKLASINRKRELNPKVTEQVLTQRINVQ